MRDAAGFPAPMTSDGKRAQPFWSSRSRVEHIIKSAPAYEGFEPVRVTWEDFCAKWVPGLTKDGYLVGVNWSGQRVVGYDLEPINVQESVQAVMEDLQ
jgi:hypothetical protein